MFGISRALIGSLLANALKYPPGSTFGILAWFRMQARYEHVLNRIIPGKMRSDNFGNFTALMDASGLDEVGDLLQDARPRLRGGVKQVVGHT